MPNYIYIASSLDGYIADSDGGVDWLHETPAPEGDDLGFAEFIAKIDAIVMGRNTYEVVLSFGEWPYTVPVFVLSNTLREVDARLKGKAEIITGTPPEIVQSLANKGFHSLYIDGGRTIQSFLAADLIDEMIIATIPKILGAGIPLFSKELNSKKFVAYKAELLSIQAVKNVL